MSQVLLALGNNPVFKMMVKPVQMTWTSVMLSFPGMEKIIASLICMNRVTMGVGGVHYYFI